MTALTVAGLTLREASRRRVLLGARACSPSRCSALSAWGFAKLAGLETLAGTLTSGESRLVASQLLNLVMFGMSLIAALGTAFLAGPTLAGEIESGHGAADARPAGPALGGAARQVAGPGRRSAAASWSWPDWPSSSSSRLTVGLLAAATGRRARAAGRADGRPADPGAAAVERRVDRWPRASSRSACSGRPGSPAWSAAWARRWATTACARVGTVSRILLPTDGLWRGAMHAFQDPTALAQFGPERAGFPFLSEAPLTAAYLVWAAVWVAMVWGLTALSFRRRDV